MTNSELQQKRLVAAAIDGGIAIALAIVVVIGSAVLGFVTGRMGAVGAYVPRIIYFLGAAVMTAYVLGRDVLAGDRSFGKKIQGIRVVTGGNPISVMESVKRNLIFGVGAILGLLSATFQLVPCLGTAVACLLWPLQILAGLATFVAVIIEVVKITQDPDGIRLGDQFANTRVVL